MGHFRTHALQQQPFIPSPAMVSMGESPAGGAVGLSAITLVARSKRRPGDGKIAAYAINRHRHVIDAKPHYCLPMEANRIAFAIFCSFNDTLCDQLVHSVKMREVPKRTTSLIKRGPHCADRLVIKDKE
jgi:hypothetical protein